MSHIKTLQIIFNGDSFLLDNLDFCDKLLNSLVEALGLNCLDSIFHSFQPQGVSIVKLLSESHIAIHTWPEDGSGYITLTTCNTEDHGQDIYKDILANNGLKLVRYTPVETETK